MVTASAEQAALGRHFDDISAPYGDTWSAQSLDIPAVKSAGLRHFLTSHLPTHLIWKNDQERPEALIYKFAERGVPKQAFKWSGWMGNIGPHRSQLPDLARAFNGVEGFHFFNGVQMHDLDSGQILPTISDVPLALKRSALENERANKTVLIGIIPKIDDMPRYVDGIGLVMRVDNEDNFFTSVAQEQDIAQIMQPDVNSVYERREETEECARICRKLFDRNWPVTLVVFGGSVTDAAAKKLSTVEEELMQWTAFARKSVEHPQSSNLNVILIKGSGGVADKYASNSQWLAENPCVKVVDLNARSIRDQLIAIGLSCSSSSR